MYQRSESNRHMLAYEASELPIPTPEYNGLARRFEPPTLPKDSALPN